MGFSLWRVFSSVGIRGKLTKHRRELKIFLKRKIKGKEKDIE